MSVSGCFATQVARAKEQSATIAAKPSAESAMRGAMPALAWVERTAFRGVGFLLVTMRPPLMPCSVIVAGLQGRDGLLGGNVACGCAGLLASAAGPSAASPGCTLTAHGK